jgi:hypothetical protein
MDGFNLIQTCKSKNTILLNAFDNDQNKNFFFSMPVRSLADINKKRWRAKGNPVTGPEGPIGWVEVYLNSFLTSALKGGVWSASRPGRLYPRERPGTHCTGGWWAPEPVWIGAENLAALGFDPRIFQPVASRYIDWAIPAPINKKKQSLL